MISRLLINSEWQETEEIKKILYPYDYSESGSCFYANAFDIENAIQSAEKVKNLFKMTSRILRSTLLETMAKKINKRKKDFINSIIEESGKPVSLAETEVTRAISTFEIGAEETKRYSGEIIPLDLDTYGTNFLPAKVVLEPKGIILAISPFNFPLNLVAHKVVPAFAIGAPIILKPPPQAPGASTILGEIFLESIKEMKEKIAGSIFQIIHTENHLAETMVKDKRIQILSFTGSDKVGWELQKLASQKKVCLELGGNASLIIEEDADIELATNRAIFAAFAYSGQVCISLQKLFIHKNIYNVVKEIILNKTKSVVSGDPNDPKVLNGPLIDRKAIERLKTWMDEAVQKGGKILTGGSFDKNIMSPTVFENIPEDCHLNRDEAFGPVLILDSFSNEEDAIGKANSSRFGLQTGVFTNSLYKSQRYSAELESGTVLINEAPIYRADHFPYGGVKDSGLGREGVKYAMEEFSERKLIIERRLKS